MYSVPSNISNANSSKNSEFLLLNNEFREDQFLFGFNLYATTYSYVYTYLYNKIIGNNATNCTTSTLYNTTNYSIPYTITLNNSNSTNNSNSSYTLNLLNSYSENFDKNITSCYTYFNATNATFSNSTTIYVTNGLINIKVIYK